MVRRRLGRDGLLSTHRRVHRLDTPITALASGVALDVDLGLLVGLEPHLVHEGLNTWIGHAIEISRTNRHPIHRRALRRAHTVLSWEKWSKSSPSQEHLALLARSLQQRVDHIFGDPLALPPASHHLHVGLGDLGFLLWGYSGAGLAQRLKP